MATATRSLESLAADIRRLLERARAAVDDEIRHYPTPIPRCDAQFNRLYEQRLRLAQALACDDDAAFIRTFAGSEPFDDSDEERLLRSQAASALDRSRFAKAEDGVGER